MSTPIRRLAAVVMALFVLLMGAAVFQQAIAAGGYRTDPRNVRNVFDRAVERRGAMITADGVTVARSERTTSDRYVRGYPLGAQYAHITGYASALFGETALESSQGSVLRAEDDGSLGAKLESWLGADLEPRDIHLTINDDLQQAALEALAGNIGAIVALDPRDGRVLAMVAAPSYNPNLLIGLDPSDGDHLAADRAQPLVSRATRALYPPGSTFKVITAAAAIEYGIATPDDRFLNLGALDLPGSEAVILNPGGRRCGAGDTVTLADAMAASCNTVFAALGMEVGPEGMAMMASAFGFGQTPPIEIETIASSFPDPGSIAGDLAALAQDAIGERDVRATPLQMALVAAAIAGNGTIPVPTLVAEVVTASGTISKRDEPVTWKRAVSPGTATVLRELLLDVVARGTGTEAAADGLLVGGKTGTAEVPGAAPHTWFIGFATTPDGRRIALAVLIESGGHLGVDGTGGTVAAPIARMVLEAWRDL